MKNIIHVPNGSRYEENGWIRINIKGNPAQRGEAYGRLIRDLMPDIVKAMSFVMEDDYGVDINTMKGLIYDIFSPIVTNNYPELMEEINAIAKGVNSSGADLKFIFFWNCYYSFSYIFGKLPEIISSDPNLSSKYGHVFPSGVTGGASEGGAGDKCSAFIAVGDWTDDGKIVCAHNTFDNYIESQFVNVMLCVKPDKGNSFLMQTAPGQVSSGTDYYVTSNGFIVTETTIGGFNQFKLLNPVFCRIRRAVQYSHSLDDYVKFLEDGNSGDYANSWLVGDTRNNEIMRIELGLNFVNVEKKKNGYFIGFNAPYDGRIRNLECSNTGFNDIRRHQGARKVRLEQLMIEHKGKITVEIGQEILGDHYDVYLNKINPCSRTCCSHYDLDQREYMSQADRPLPYQPRGALDGIVCSTALARRMGLSARWGSSCGMPFHAKEFFERNIQWKQQAPYVVDRPYQPWTVFTCAKRHHMKTGKHRKSKGKGTRQSKA